MSESDIPADIRRLAWELVKRSCSNEVCSVARGCGCSGAIAEALLQERERCAKIAEAVGRAALHPDASAIAGAVIGTATTIAAAIRRPDALP